MWIEWSNGLVNLDQAHRIYLIGHEIGILILGSKYVRVFETENEAIKQYIELVNKIFTHVNTR